MKELIISLMLWIGSNTDYNTDFPVPHVERMGIIMEEIIFPNYEGFYDYKKNIIYIRRGLDIKDSWTQGVLLHEVIHYLQDMNNAQFECTAEMEKDAWPLQKKYLKEVHNYIWNYDILWYLVISDCGQY